MKKPLCVWGGMVVRRKQKNGITHRICQNHPILATFTFRFLSTRLYIFESAFQVENSILYSLTVGIQVSSFINTCFHVVEKRVPPSQDRVQHL